MTAKRKPPKTAWKPGQSGNPAGRPKGARVRLSDAFLRDVADHWQNHGVEAIQRTFAEKPDVYFKTIASLLPRDVKVSGDVSHQHEHTVISESTQRVLDELAGRGENAGDEVSRTH